jgi:hypothetical protein
VVASACALFRNVFAGPTKPVDAIFVNATLVSETSKDILPANTVTPTHTSNI